MRGSVEFQRGSLAGAAGVACHVFHELNGSKKLAWLTLRRYNGC